MRFHAVKKTCTAPSSGIGLILYNPRDERSAKVTIDPSALITVTSCVDLGEAHIKRGALEAAGIDAFIDNEALVSAYPSLGYAQAIRIQVRAAQVRAARQILDTVSVLPKPHNNDADVDLHDDVDPCPACGSVHVFKIGMKSDQKNASSPEGLDARGLARHTRYRCVECGEIWSPNIRRTAANFGLALMWGLFLAGTTLAALWLIEWIRFL